MTEANQKILYEHFLKTGQTERAKAISNIPRYAKFAKPVVTAKSVIEETKSKGVK